MIPAKLPKELRKLMTGRSCERNGLGCSAAEVYRLRGENDSLWLKAEPEGGELKREAVAAGWLAGKLPVPEVLYFGSSDGFDYLLMTEMPGAEACSDEAAGNPADTVRLLAEGIRMFYTVDIASCPLDNRLDRKLAEAESNVKLGLVDISDWEPDNPYGSPEALLRYLNESRPTFEDLAFTHGDYCLPNIFLRDGKISGFIDLGRAGVADRWQDIALCVRSMHHNLKTDAYDEYLFTCLGIQPDFMKLNYYILLDELF